MLGEYRRSTRIVLVANPAYRETYVRAGGSDSGPSRSPIAAALKGKRLPLAGRIEISIIEEGQARWLAFLNREIDFLDVLPTDFIDQALDRTASCGPTLAAKGIVHEVLLRPNTRWTYFNMEDPIVGGYTPEKIALRRAIGMGYDNDECDPRAAEGPRGARRRPDPAGHRRLRSERSRRRRSSTIPRRRARCSTGSATRTATATAIAKCPTASRS